MSLKPCLIRPWPSHSVAGLPGIASEPLVEVTEEHGGTFTSLGGSGFGRSTNVVSKGLFEVLNFALLDYGLQEVLLLCGGGFGRSTNYYFGGSFGAPSTDTLIRFQAGVGTPMPSISRARSARDPAFILPRVDAHLRIAFVHNLGAHSPRRKKTTTTTIITIITTITISTTTTTAPTR